MKLEDARFLKVSVAGAIVSPLPPGLTASDLNPTALLGGQTVTGREGNLVFAAAPVHLTDAQRQRLGRRGS